MYSADSTDFTGNAQVLYISDAMSSPTPAQKRTKYVRDENRAKQGYMEQAEEQSDNRVPADHAGE
jgi:hypothetical protein